MNVASGDKPRRPWVAALLAGVIPGLGHLYVGRLRPAILFAVVTPSPLAIAAVAGAYHPSLLLPLILIGVALHVSFWIAAVVSALVLARRKRTSYELTRYNHAAVYAGFALASWIAGNVSAGYIRSSLVEPFRIPSGGMLPTLVPGDLVFATKVGARCQRGDVAVFKNPLQTDVDFIQRIIGLPGDRIRIENAHIYLNGVEQPKRLLDPLYVVHLGFGDEIETEAGQLLEETLGARPYRILERASACGRPQNPNCTFEGGREFVIPPDHAFVMGDNREKSADSRFGFGAQGKGLEFVPLANIKGRVVVIWLSFSLLEGIRWNRIGQTL